MGHYYVGHSDLHVKAKRRTGLPVAMPPHIGGAGTIMMARSCRLADSSLLPEAALYSPRDTRAPKHRWPFGSVWTAFGPTESGGSEVGTRKANGVLSISAFSPPGLKF